MSPSGRQAARPAGCWERLPGVVNRLIDATLCPTEACEEEDPHKPLQRCYKLRHPLARPMSWSRNSGTPGVFDVVASQSEKQAAGGL